MKFYTKKTTEAGQVQYREDGKLVSKDKIAEEVLVRIDIVPEGTKVSESTDIVDSNAEDKLVDPIVAAPEVETKKISLEMPIYVANGEGSRVYQPEKEYELPVHVADDLLRIQKEQLTYQANLIKSQNRTRKVSDVKDVSTPNL